MKIYTWLRQEQQQQRRGAKFAIEEDAAGLLGVDDSSVSGRNKRRFTMFYSKDRQHENKKNTQHYRSKSSGSASTHLTVNTEESYYCSDDEFDLTCIDPTGSDGTSVTQIHVIRLDKPLTERIHEDNIIETLSELEDGEVEEATSDSYEGLSCIMEENSMDVSQGTAERSSDRVVHNRIENGGAFEPFCKTFTQSVEWDEYGKGTDASEDSDFHVLVDDNRSQVGTIGYVPQHRKNKNEVISHGVVMDADCSELSGSAWTTFDTATSGFVRIDRGICPSAVGMNLGFAKERSQIAKDISNDDMTYSDSSHASIENPGIALVPDVCTVHSAGHIIHGTVLADKDNKVECSTDGDEVEINIRTEDAHASANRCFDGSKAARNSTPIAVDDGPSFEQNDAELTAMNNFDLNCNNSEEREVKEFEGVTDSVSWNNQNHASKGTKMGGSFKNNRNPLKTWQQMYSRALDSCSVTGTKEKEKDVHAFFDYVASKFAEYADPFPELNEPEEKVACEKEVTRFEI
jgi:hypothetical protein